MRKIVCTVVAVSLGLAGLAAGQGNGAGHSKDQIHKEGQNYSQAGTLSLITSAERLIILGYIQNHQGNPPPAFAGMKPLPPGIAKKIARGGTMPPGIAKQYFPSDLLGQLPPRLGQQWLVIGTDVLLIDAATQIILDILHQGH